MTTASPHEPNAPLDLPDRLRVEEYAALRATIRERGSLRPWLVVVTLASWAGIAMGADRWLGTPVSTLIPLLVLAAGFEAAFALHVGVERIGRYLQVEYEGRPGAPGWEHAAMRFGAGPSPAAGRVDPLFSSIFLFGALLNLVPVLLATIGVPGGMLELAVFGLVHVALMVRIGRARAFASRQRALDLAMLTRTQDAPDA